MAKIPPNKIGKSYCKWGQEEALFPETKNKRKPIAATKKKNFEVNKTIKFR